MKKIIINIFLIFIILITLVGCNKNEKVQIQKNNEIDLKEELKMNIIINNKEYTIDLEDNETTKELIKKLPLKLNMKELNGNEKYYYLDFNLPTKSYSPKKINNGDVMLYGNNCLVIFYKTFETSYSYTKIGHINNLPNLGSDNIVIEFK